MMVRSGIFMLHMTALPLAVVVTIAITRLYTLFKTTETGWAWKIALIAVYAFLLHYLSCLAGVLVGDEVGFLTGLARATGFMTLLAMGTAILAVYKALVQTGRMPHIADPFDLRDQEALPNGGKGSRSSDKREG